MQLKLFLYSLIYLFVLTPNAANAAFDFCPENSNAEGGSGSFQQEIPLNGIVEIGELPIGLSEIEIFLTATVDIDIQLYDKETGEKIIHWPNGILSGSGYQSTVYHGIKIEWSGYNGDGTGAGNEFIKLSDNNDPSAPMSRAFIMKVFGYHAGIADVNYSWGGTNCDTSGSGNGSFQQQIVKDAIVKVGDIPTGVNNLEIYLEAQADVDIQLYDTETGTAIIAWPNGLLNGSSPASITYQDMDIEWSGYNGDGTNPGKEYIKITGATTVNLTMKAFGYQSGLATVNYSWGDSDDDDSNDDETGDSTEASSKAEILQLINQARKQGRNCGDTFFPSVAPLTWNSQLYQAALGHSEDMANNDYFNHTGLDGRSAGQRITDAGYTWNSWSENIAAGYFSAQSVMDGWLSSPGHCRNIMSSKVSNVATAKATGGSYGIYWTQVFARPD